MYVGHREEADRPQRASLVSFPDFPGVSDVLHTALRSGNEADWSCLIL